MTLELLPEIRARVLADSRDRQAWLDVRSGKSDGLVKIGGSDAAGYAKRESADKYLRSKLASRFEGNAYTQHGNQREARMLRVHGFEQNTLLIHSPDDGDPYYRRHVATPDGIRRGADGKIELAQAKTTSKPFANRFGEFHMPPAYERQMLWELYVCDAFRSAFIFELHENFRPLQMEPEIYWLYRDDEKIADLIEIANTVLAGCDAARAFRTELREGTDR
ncbi:MAG: hypothetical protein AB7R77_26265 [Ilumatobacteraceae bacterium]